MTDPLSDVLSLLKPETCIAGGFDFGGKWALQFEKHAGLKYFALVSGSAWIAVDSGQAPVRLEAGDCVLLPNGRRFLIAQDLAAVPVSITTLPEEDWNGGIATVNGGGETTMLGGHFGFAGEHINILLGSMPAIIRLRDEDDKEGLRWALERMRQELFGDQPGARLVIQHLAHLMLVQALRLYLAHGMGNGAGWLFALSDERIAAAISAIHTSPGSRWTLPALAQKAGMSRSRFALRFKSISGASPIEYLTRWRMMLACDRLTRGTESVSRIALSLGYESEAAFSTAFRRLIGCSPRRYALKKKSLAEITD
ncbi:AraC family transcriptional regulator [Chimaeribacter coloradensis]|uniref:AraC family transcriptional regulator n=1 Tax=Chimaeribacter coloradensis TaxID=2060068 RepID=A0A2N5E5X1_9GAMM|nr:AraC family transcriptional regulator [Chimaeribacter coloradensis]PLR36538.1 AraC family transcriptional regulator [Chimaeribacter coloradensis]